MKKDSIALRKDCFTTLPFILDLNLLKYIYAKDQQPQSTAGNSYSISD